MKRHLYSLGIGLASFVAGFAMCYVFVAQATPALTPTFFALQRDADQPQWRAYVVQPTYPPKFQGEM